jgi:hypothetical protein
MVIAVGSEQKLVKGIIKTGYGVFYFLGNCIDTECKL